MANRFSIEAVFKAIDKITAPVSKMQNRVGKFTRRFSRGLKTVNRNMDNVMRGMRRFGTVGLVALTLIAGGLADIIRTGAEFEQTIVNAAAKFPGEIKKGTEAFKQLEDAAKRTGATTEFTARETAQALNFLAMAGFDAQQAVAALPKVVDLATASQTDLATATDIATDSLGAFGLAVKDPIQLSKNLARITDVLAKTTVTANTDMVMLFETIKQGAPVATAAGASIETFATLAGTMANSGIKASVAGTTLKNVFTRLAKPPSEAAKALKKLRVETVDSNGNMRDSIDVLADIRKALKDKGTATRTAALNDIFGKRALAGASILVGTSTAKLKKYREELTNSTGAAADMAAMMRDTTLGRIKMLNSAFEGLKISLFGIVVGPLSDIVVKMTEWIRVNEDLITGKFARGIDFIVKNFRLIVTWAKRIGIAIAIFVTLTGVLKVLGAVMTVVNAIAMMNPYVLAAVAIVGLIAAIALLIKNFDKIREKTPEIKKAILGTFESLPTPVRIAIRLLYAPLIEFGKLAFFVMENWEALEKFFKLLWATIVGHFEWALNKIKGVTDKINRTIEKIPGVKKAMKFHPLAIAAMPSRFIGEKIADRTQKAPSRFEKALGGMPIMGAFNAIREELARDKNMVSPQERNAKTIEEKRETSTAEVTIKTEKGTTAEVSKGFLGTGITLQPTGGF